MRAMNKKVFLPVLIILFSIPYLLNAQISIDRGLRAAGLWCFPLVSDSNTWLYLPDRSLLAMDENKKPQFSFIRYVNAPVKPKEGEDVVTNADGGAVLHFL